MDKYYRGWAKEEVKKESNSESLFKLNKLPEESLFSEIEEDSLDESEDHASEDNSKPSIS